MKKYRKKPIAVEAAQWTGGNLSDWKAFLASNELPLHWPMGSRGGKVGGIIRHEKGGFGIICEAGDWIVKDQYGKYSPYSPDVFERFFEPVE